MRDGPREVTLNRAWTPRRTNELHLRPAGLFLCCAEGASIDFVNGLLRNACPAFVPPGCSRRSLKRRTGLDGDEQGIV